VHDYSSLIDECRSTQKAGSRVNSQEHTRLIAILLLVANNKCYMRCVASNLFRKTSMRPTWISSDMVIHGTKPSTMLLIQREKKQLQNKSVISRCDKTKNDSRVMLENANLLSSDMPMPRFCLSHSLFRNYSIFLVRTFFSWFLFINRSPLGSTPYQSLATKGAWYLSKEDLVDIYAIFNYQKT